MKTISSLLCFLCLCCNNIDVQKEQVYNIKGSKKDFQNLEWNTPIYSRTTDKEVYFSEIVGDTIRYRYDIEFKDTIVSGIGYSAYYHFYISK